MTYSAEVLADSVLAYWRQGEASGTTMTDSSGNSHPGTYTNVPTQGVTGLLTGDADTANNYDGSADLATVSTGVWMDVTSITVEAWCSPDVVPSGTAFEIMGRDTGTFAGSSKRGWHLRLSTTGVPQFVFWASDGGLEQIMTGTTTVEAAGVYHIVGTYNGTVAKLYVNGAEEATLSIAGAINTGNVGDIKIGQAPPSNSNKFDGTLDEIAIYSTALSATRVSDHYDAGTGGGPPPAATITLAADHPRDTAALTLAVRVDMSLAADHPRDTAAFTLLAAADMQLAAEHPRDTGVFDLEAVAEVIEIELAAEHPRDTATFTLETLPFVTLAGEHPRDTGYFTLLAGADLTLAGEHPRDTATFVVSSADRTVILAGQHPRDTASFTLSFPPQTDKSNNTSGLVLTGYANCPWEPPVVDPEVGIIGPVRHGYEVARAHSVPVLTEAAPPTFAVTTARAVRHLDRIIVGGKDITYWRGVHTPTPDYDLIDPLTYGAGTLQLPQVHALYEMPQCAPGGTLPFLAPGKRVVVQRVDPETGEVVSADDYRGFISDYDIDGNNLTLILGGEMSGRMSTMWRPTPAWKAFRDIGRMVFNAFLRMPGRFTPYLGPSTGITIPTFGGVWMIDFVSEVLAKAVQADGDQWTAGRRANGTWGMWIKDTTTIDATIYFDDSAMKPQLKQSLSEQHNRVFVTAVAKDGRRINFRVYPGLKHGPPPPYPLASSAPFGEGTTNDDMDNPEDAPITAMIHRLIVTGYLSRVEEGGDYLYDADVTRAIRRLQDDTGLSETGIMNLATWKRLYDLDATGYTLAGTMTLPAAQDPRTRIWDRTASGALAAKNPLHDPSVILVDLPLSMGPVKNRQKARELAKGKLSTGGDWIGTVECHLALIRGEHNPGDPLVDADVMTPRDLRPNMNVWAPLWGAEGTLFHVSGLNVRDRGKVVTPLLDTRARPSMEAWEVAQRNAESRKNLTRLWINEYRGSKIDKDGGEWDDVAGLVDDRIRLRGGHWTWFPVVAGQEGTIRSLRTRINPAERYAMAIFGRRVGDKYGASPWLDRKVPNPLSEAGSERWDKPWVRKALDDRILLYTAGQFEQALGYFPGQETNDRTGNPTGNPVNGRWEDDAGFSFHTFAEPVLYVAIWVPDDTSLLPGRLMWDQFEQGA